MYGALIYFNIVGMCPFLPNLKPQGSYLFLPNGTMLVKCTEDDHEVFSGCGISGEWNNTEDYCISINEMPLNGK